jgi:hypothetical protein
MACGCSGSKKTPIEVAQKFIADSRLSGTIETNDGMDILSFEPGFAFILNAIEEKITRETAPVADDVDATQQEPETVGV